MSGVSSARRCRNQPKRDAQIINVFCVVKLKIVRAKVLIISCFLVAMTGCAQTASPPNQVTVQPTAPVPSTPYHFPDLSESELVTLDEHLPKKSRQILEAADQIDLFETEICLAGWKLMPIKSGEFQGCAVKRHVAITDAKKREELVKAIFYAIGSPDVEAACISPRHGIRAEANGKRLEMLICFHCHNFRGVSTYSNFRGAFSLAPEELFETLLTRNERDVQ